MHTFADVVVALDTVALSSAEMLAKSVVTMSGQRFKSRKHRQMAREGAVGCSHCEAPRIDPDDQVGVGVAQVVGMNVSITLLTVYVAESGKHGRGEGRDSQLGSAQRTLKSAVQAGLSCSLAD